MPTYTFGKEPNAYFHGQDMTITRDDGETIKVNRKDDMWAVNVKYDGTYHDLPPTCRLAVDNLPEGIVSGIEQQARENFWRDARMLAEENGYSDIFSAGRSGGWLCVDKTRTWESPNPAEPTDDEREQVEDWIAFCFEAVALIDQAEGGFRGDLRDAQQDLQIELSTYADWVGAKVRTLDGETFKVARIEVRNGRVTLMPEKPAKAFSFATEATLVQKADGNVPARITADPIMEEVFETIEARGGVTKDQLDAWLDADDDNDPSALYEKHLAPEIDAIEDAIIAHYAAPPQTSTD